MTSVPAVLLAGSVPIEVRVHACDTHTHTHTHTHRHTHRHNAHLNAACLRVWLHPRVSGCFLIRVSTGTQWLCVGTRALCWPSWCMTSRYWKPSIGNAAPTQSSILTPRRMRRGTGNPKGTLVQLKNPSGRGNLHMMMMMVVMMVVPSDEQEENGSLSISLQAGGSLRYSVWVRTLCALKVTWCRFPKLTRSSLPYLQPSLSLSLSLLSLTLSGASLWSQPEELNDFWYPPSK